jgi:hypothetical protein
MDIKKIAETLKKLPDDKARIKYLESILEKITDKKLKEIIKKAISEFKSEQPKGAKIPEKKSVVPLERIITQSAVPLVSARTFATGEDIGATALPPRSFREFEAVPAKRIREEVGYLADDKKDYNPIAESRLEREGKEYVVRSTEMVRERAIGTPESTLEKKSYEPRSSGFDQPGKEKKEDYVPHAELEKEVMEKEKEEAYKRKKLFMEV